MGGYRTCSYHGPYKSGMYGYRERGCPACKAEYEMGKVDGAGVINKHIKYIKKEEKPMAEQTAPVKTRIDQFLEAAQEMKEKNKKMQRAAKMLKKDPDLANLLEEISKFNF